MTDTNAGEPTKVPDRDNGISFKRKLEVKPNFKSHTDDEEIESAPSLKSSSNPPLPELQKDKRKLMIKPFGSLEPKTIGNFVEKEVRQHDNILLKQRNNMLSGENIKLKTRITVLEKENERLQKTIENEDSQLKPNTAFSNSRDRMKPTDSTMRAMIRGLRKEIEDMKKQNIGIKSAVKFTNLKELECERDHLAEESIRLRLALEEEQNPLLQNSNFQGVSALEHRIHSLSEKNAQLTRENADLAEKCKKIEQGSGKIGRIIESEKNLNRALLNAKKNIAEKDYEIQNLKLQLKTTPAIPSSINFTTPKGQKMDLKRPSIEQKTKPTLASLNREPKSASKQKKTQNSCDQCFKWQKQNKDLSEKCKLLEAQIQKKGKTQVSVPTAVEVQPVKEVQVVELRRFLLLRFKAHRLSHEESQKYLINCETVLNELQLDKEMTVRQLMESLFVEPFCIISNRYLQVLVVCLVYGVGQKVKIEDTKSMSRRHIIQAYLKLLPKYEILSQQKEEEMFIQVAELITTYYQQILSALTAKRNGEGTIPESAFLEFFHQIELEQDYIDFIITQIILQSLDMEHLNFYAMFEIFYMPQITAQPVTNNTMKKKKFEVEKEQIVHQEDEQFEQSRSHLGRKMTLDHRDEEVVHQQEQGSNRKDSTHVEIMVDQSIAKLKEAAQKQKQGKLNKQQEVEEERYAEQYEQEKVSREGGEGMVEEYGIDEQFQK